MMVRKYMIPFLTYVEVEDEAASKATKSRFEEHTEDLETPHSDDDEDRMFGDVTGISDDELEEVEEIRKNVKEVKERLKKGISLTYLDSQFDPDNEQRNLHKDHGNDDGSEEGFRSMRWVHMMIQIVKMTLLIAV
ncbi:unnamed protein product [Linum trigynum]|uniref:Uncharacterized protein n=1 Tax=Linum trigynum TaxID=586398 RepID=A0AAV2GLQ1_9ROSI